MSALTKTFTENPHTVFNQLNFRISSRAETNVCSNSCITPFK